MPDDFAAERLNGDSGASRRKPTVAQLGVDPAAQDWQRSGTGDGSFEVAFVRGADSLDSGTSQVDARSDAGSGDAVWADTSSGAGPDDVWVLLRVAGDPAGRVLVYDRTEWECFLDGVGRGEFDIGAELAGQTAGRRCRTVSAGRNGLRNGRLACS